MRGLGPAEFPRPVDDVAYPQKEQQGRRLDEDHPKVREARQRVDPHLRHKDAAEGLPGAHPVGLGGFHLRARHRVHRAVDDIGGKGAEDDGKCQHGQEKAVGFVDPLRAGGQRQLGRRADDKVIALPDRLIPVRTFHLVAQPFKALVHGDGNEEEKDDVRHAPHHRGIGLAEPPERQEMRPRRHRAAKAEGQRDGRGDKQQKQHDADRAIEQHVLARGQVAHKPAKALKARWIGAGCEHGRDAG